MAKIYKHLTTQERAVVMTMRATCAPPDPSKRLCRSASTISRELKRTSGSGGYDANAAHTQCMPAAFYHVGFPNCTRTAPCSK